MGRGAAARLAPVLTQGMRLEILKDGVHSSAGKVLSLARVNVPAKEGRLLVKRGFAREIQAKKRQTTPPALAIELPEVTQSEAS